MRNLGLTTVLLVALTSSPAAAGDVTTDWDRSVDFSRFKTFNWSDPRSIEVSDPVARQHLLNTITHQLNTRGLEHEDLHTDLWVVIHTSDHRQVLMSTTGFGPAWGGWGAWGGYTAVVVSAPQYSVVVDLVQRPESKLVWRSIAAGALPRKGASIDLDAIVEEMFKDFPPASPKTE